MNLLRNAPEGPGDCMPVRARSLERRHPCDRRVVLTTARERFGDEALPRVIGWPETRTSRRSQRACRPSRNPHHPAHRPARRSNRTGAKSSVGALWTTHLPVAGARRCAVTIVVPSPIGLRRPSTRMSVSPSWRNVAFTRQPRPSHHVAVDVQTLGVAIKWAVTVSGRPTRLPSPARDRHLKPPFALPPMSQPWVTVAAYDPSPTGRTAVARSNSPFITGKLSPSPQEYEREAR